MYVACQTLIQLSEASYLYRINERIEYKLLSLTYTKFSQPANLTTYTI